MEVAGVGEHASGNTPRVEETCQPRTLVRGWHRLAENLVLYG